MAIHDIIEYSDTTELASKRISTALLRREMEKTQQSIADTFYFGVTWCENAMSAEQIHRYQVIWNEYGDLMREIQLGE